MSRRLQHRLCLWLHLPSCIKGQALLLAGAWLSALHSAQVCDQPHPLLVAEIVRHCSRCHLDKAYKGMKV